MVVMHCIHYSCPVMCVYDGLVQDCSNSSALAMELLQSCTIPSIWSGEKWFVYGWLSLLPCVGCNKGCWNWKLYGFQLFKTKTIPTVSRVISNHILYLNENSMKSVTFSRTLKQEIIRLINWFRPTGATNLLPAPITWSNVGLSPIH